MTFVEYNINVIAVALMPISYLSIRLTYSFQWKNEGGSKVKQSTACCSISLCFIPSLLPNKVRKSS